MARHLLLSSLYWLLSSNGAQASTSKGTIFSNVNQEDVASGLEAGQQALAVVDLVVELFAKENAHGTMVKIAVSGQHDNDQDKEGSVGIIWAFDEFNGVLGSSDVKPDRIDAGSFADIEIHQFLGEKRTAQYIDLIASDDEICISYIQASTFDSSKAPFVWLGDVGRQCGQSWEYGSTSITGGNSVQYYPACTWLDQDHGDDIDKKMNTDTITNRQMKINLASYANMNATNGTFLTDVDLVCGSTIFTWDMDDPIAGGTPRGPYFDEEDRLHLDTRALQTRSTYSKKARPQSAKMAERLWVNSRPLQSAVALCDSPSSRGSDFLSVDEGLFCDMDTKTLYPLCTSNNTLGCFDLEADKLQLRRRGGAKLQQRSKSVKQYKKISYAD